MSQKITSTIITDFPPINIEKALSKSDKVSIIKSNNTIIESAKIMNGASEITERLLRLDEDAALLFDGNERFQCILVGGSALVLLGYISRATHDIDVLQTPQELLQLLKKYDMNTDVCAYMDNFPDDYHDRITKIDLPTEKVDFYTLSLEDLVISKLNSGRRKDMADIVSETVISKLNWKQLAQLAETVKEGMLSDRSVREFEFAYKEFVERYQR